MIINFQNTAQNSQAQVEFFNSRGQVVKSYPLSVLEGFVIANKLNISSEHEAKGGTGMISDPNTDFIEKAVYEDVTDFLDRTWVETTKAFYIDRNPSEFESNNTPHQTLK